MVSCEESLKFQDFALRNKCVNYAIKSVIRISNSMSTSTQTPSVDRKSSGIVNQILNSFRNEKKGRIILACWVGVGCLASIYGSYIRGRQRKAWKEWRESEKLEYIITPGNNSEQKDNSEEEEKEAANESESLTDKDLKAIETPQYVLCVFYVCMLNQNKKPNTKNQKQQKKFEICRK